MDFARRQLRSMGWEEGKGLGKNEDGISKPLKLRVQRDFVGLGFDRNTSSLNTEVWFKELDQVIVEARKKKNGKKQKPEDGTQEVTSSIHTHFVKPKDEDEDDCEKVVKKRKKSKTGMDLNDIFKKSKGVTCHRSAHVGISMGGKMMRLQEQDEQFARGKS